MEMMEGAALDGDEVWRNRLQPRNCCCWRSTEIPIVTLKAAEVTPGGHHEEPSSRFSAPEICLFGLKPFNVMRTSA